MKKRLIILVLILIPLVILGALILSNKTTTPTGSSAASNEVIVDIRSNILKIGEESYAWYEVEDSEKMKLIPNFDEKLSSSQVGSENKCKFISSASFYSTDNKPLGLFVSDDTTLANYSNNSLLDGVISINDMTTPRITREVPQDHLRIALQTGPIIKENNSFLTLKIQSDSPARRLVAGVTGTNKLYFIVIYKTDSEYMGPNLADLPNKLAQFEKTSGITFADIVNLDGGAASTFADSSLKLTEFNPVGAFFCQL